MRGTEGGGWAGGYNIAPGFHTACLAFHHFVVLSKQTFLLALYFHCKAYPSDPLNVVTYVNINILDYISASVKYQPSQTDRSFFSELIRKLLCFFHLLLWLKKIYTQLFFCIYTLFLHVFK